MSDTKPITPESLREAGWENLTSLTVDYFKLAICESLSLAVYRAIFEEQWTVSIADDCDCIELPRRFTTMPQLEEFARVLKGNE